MKKIKKARRSSKQYFNSINGLNSFQNNDQMHYNYNRLGSENVITCTNPKTNIYDCDKLCLCRFMAAKIKCPKGVYAKADKHSNNLECVCREDGKDLIKSVKQDDICYSIKYCKIKSAFESCKGN